MNHEMTHEMTHEMNHEMTYEMTHEMNHNSNQSLNDKGNRPLIGKTDYGLKQSDYFLLKQTGLLSVPGAEDSGSEEPSVRVMDDTSSLEKFDYLSAEALVSDRLKLLLEQYLPEQAWRPCAFVDLTRQTQKIFWFLPPLPYTPDHILIAPNGTLLSIRVKEADFAKKAPGIYRIRNPNGFDTDIYISYFF